MTSFTGIGIRDEIARSCYTNNIRLKTANWHRNIRADVPFSLFWVARDSSCPADSFGLDPGGNTKKSEE